jgi:flavin reductase
MNFTLGRGVTRRADSAAFRNTMQHLCGAVVVVSTELEGRDIGMAATAVCSISDEPPTVMVCINKRASVHYPLSVTGRYTISILSEDSVDVAHIFSSKDEDARRERLRRFAGERGMRAVSGALAVLHCRVVQELDCGTHSAFFAEVEANCVLEPGAAPLLYFHQAFHGRAESLAAHRPQHGRTTHEH